MRHLQNSRNKSLVVVALSTLVIMVVMALGGAGGNATDLTARAFQSPIETPTPIPSPTSIPPSPPPPSGPSAEGQLALNYVAATYGLAPENLRVANEHGMDRRGLRLLGAPVPDDAHSRSW